MIDRWMIDIWQDVMVRGSPYWGWEAKWRTEFVCLFVSLGLMVWGCVWLSTSGVSGRGTAGCVTTRYVMSCISNSLQIMDGKALGFSLCASSAKVHIFVQPCTSRGNQHRSLGEPSHFSRWRCWLHFLQASQTSFCWLKKMPLKLKLV